MAETIQDLPYGHFGNLEYDPVEKEWTFQRQPRAHYALKVLTDAKRVIPATSPDDTTKSTSDPEPPSTRYSKQISELLKICPEVEPAADLLPELLRLSEAVESAASTHDAFRGSLFAIGTIPAEAIHTGLAEIAAFPTGPNGDDLRLTLVSKTQLSWKENPGFGLEVPNVLGEDAIWEGPGVAIQQICFAEPMENARTHLAVRLPTRTVIFRPVLRKRPLRPETLSRIDPAVIGEVTISQTNGSPHVSVAFNPWFTRQFAVMSLDGSWSIWEMSFKATTIKAVCKGEAPKETEELLVSDGWGKVMWVANPGTLVAATRAGIHFYAVDREDPSLIRSVKFPTWLLDVTTIPEQPQYLLVLTGSFIELYDVDRECGLVVRLRHYRNGEDLSLRLSVLADDDDHIVLLRSTLQKTVDVFRIKLDHAGAVQVISDPCSVELPSEDAGESQLSDLKLVPAKYTVWRGMRREGRCEEYSRLSVRFYSLIMLWENQAVTQALCHALPYQSHDAQVDPPIREKKGKDVVSKLNKESFVVDDDELEHMPKRTSQPGLVPSRTLSEPDKSDPSWTVDYRFSAYDLQAQIQNGMRGLMDTLTDIVPTVQALDQDRLRASVSLADLFPHAMSISDVEGCSHQLESLDNVEIRTQDESQQSFEEETRMILRPLDLPHIPALHHLRQGSGVSSIYDSMVSEWVASLDGSVKSNVRLARDKLVRSASAQIALGSRVLQRETRIQEEPEVPPSSPPLLPINIASEWDLPLRADRPTQSPRSPIFDNQMYSSQLPTPTPTGTPSVTTASSLHTMSEELHRLGKYTSFDRMTPVIGSRSVSSILSHWQLGSDPASYDWISNSRRVARQVEAEELEGADMTEKERARMQRRAERHIRRQRREAAASQLAQLRSSQAPELVSASQPQPEPRRSKRAVYSQQTDLGALASSSQRADDSQSQNLALASQVQPGRFGGRPSASIAKKKKRKLGF